MVANASDRLGDESWWILPLFFTQHLDDYMEKITNYTCGNCLSSILTVQKTEGITKKIISCTVCANGVMHGSSIEQSDEAPTHEWIRTPRAQRRAIKNKEAREYFKKGGLVLKKL